jgi:hypothetical protein
MRPGECLPKLLRSPSSWWFSYRVRIGAALATSLPQPSSNSLTSMRIPNLSRSMLMRQVKLRRWLLHARHYLPLLNILYSIMKLGKHLQWLLLSIWLTNFFRSMPTFVFLKEGKEVWVPDEVDICMPTLNYPDRSIGSWAPTKRKTPKSHDTYQWSDCATTANFKIRWKTSRPGHESARIAWGSNMSVLFLVGHPCYNIVKYGIRINALNDGVVSIGR